MATNPVPPRPVWQHPLLVPGLFLAAALLFLISGDGTFAFAFLLGAIGTALYFFGKVKRWKGAPEAGLLVCAIGAVMALMALFG